MTEPEPGSEPDPPASPAEQLQRLREDVDMLLVTRAKPRADTPDASWQAMSPARAAEAWAALIEWVDELVDRYALDEVIPGCWYAHGAMVEELHALHAAWRGAYTGRAGHPTDRALWHDLLAHTLTRVGIWNRRGCAAGTHRPDQPVGPSEAQRTARAGYVHADLQARARRDGAESRAAG